MTVFDISTAFYFMICILDLEIFLNDDLHFIFEKFLEEQIDVTYIDPLFLFLEFLAHSFHHDLFNLPVSFLSFNDVLVASIESIIKGADFTISFILFMHDRSFD